MESSNGGGIPGSYALHQHGEAGVQQGLENLPTYGFRNNGPDSDQLQADRSHLLFGVSIDPSLGTSSVLPSPDYEKAKDAAGNNMLPGTFCPSATPVDSGNLTSEGLDENVLMQRNLTWPVVQTAHPVRSFTKVGIWPASSSICLNILLAIVCLSFSSWILRCYMLLTFPSKLLCHHLRFRSAFRLLFNYLFAFALECNWGFIDLLTSFYLLQLNMG